MLNKNNEEKNLKKATGSSPAAEGTSAQTDNKKAIVRYGIIAVIVCIVIGFIALNYENLAPDRVGEWLGESFASMGTGKGFPYAVSSTSVRQLEKMNKDVAVLTDTSVIVLNSSAKEVAKRQHGFANPVMDVADQRILLYDQGGKRLRIENRGKILFEKTMDQNIITGDISESGCFAIATQSNTSSGELKVYSRNFNEILTWYSSGNHIIDVAVAPDGKSAAIAVAGAQGGEMKSTIYIIDFSKEEPVAQFDYLSTMFLRLDYTSKNVIIAAGDHLISIIGPDRQKLEDISYEHSTLKRSITSTQPNACMLYSMFDSGNLNDLLLIGEDGSLRYKVAIKQDVRWIDHDGTESYALCSDKLYWYDANGKERGSVDVEADGSRVIAFGNQAYVLGMNEIRSYTLQETPQKE